MDDGARANPIDFDITAHGDLDGLVHRNVLGCHVPLRHHFGHDLRHHLPDRHHLDTWNHDRMLLRHHAGHRHLNRLGLRDSSGLHHGNLLRLFDQFLNLLHVALRHGISIDDDLFAVTLLPLSPEVLCSPGHFVACACHARRRAIHWRCHWASRSHRRRPTRVVGRQGLRAVACRREVAVAMRGHARAWRRRAERGSFQRSHARRSEGTCGHHGDGSIAAGGGERRAGCIAGVRHCCQVRCVRFIETDVSAWGRAGAARTKTQTVRNDCRSAVRCAL